MQNNFRNLIIKPKTESTVVAVFQNEVCIFKETIPHNTSAANLLNINLEAKQRKDHILTALKKMGINLSMIDVVCSNGGLIRSVEGGTYEVNETMIHDLLHHYNGVHASNLGALLGHNIAHDLNVPAYIVDPPVVNELSELATCTGLPGIERKSIFHALNQKYVARRAADELQMTYEHMNLIVAHIGLGITIGAHQNGKVIDVNNGLHGDGPFSIERAGTIPSEGLIELCYSGTYTKEQLIKEITYHGGLKAYLQTDNISEIERRIESGNQEAKRIFQGMGYQIVKEIGAMSSALKGTVDAVVLTGQLSYSKFLTEFIIEHVHWIADVFVYPGEFDVIALNEAALRVLRKQEKLKHYYSKNRGVQ